ncbi:preprotein translocase subunit SecA [Eubacterium callanderi]|uniref:preprotein translocase subunit SecA n=1 Tax=Eubacterium callanderi TaxID=53442 RepID=UPI001D0867F0|nr:preprotein translocase subunit SecA [Eubacterium callanderi]MCB6660913.1 preprotein translocase subunit SecA [Eubacterium callanderi]MCB6753783.1 preprotein translocase subunit SecA [Eubacterium callanderi]MCB7105664.1 preprotein translocase subunit SecA [Eubacterium callanderi]MCG4821012.1 preprotein translocase subunit SecA [Eubacterium callanderi]MCQ5190786.1 preprotein translocase subunit SecA [Eubacterium callanderi]
MAALNQIFDPSRRDVKRLQKTADRILALEDAMAALSDSALRDKTALFRKRLKDGEPLDNLTAEAFAVVREAAYRAIGLKPFPVQLIGGLVLHEGNIAEMKTGEGKTLVAALPTYLNALEGKGVFVVTVNDYLARRDRELMGKIHEFLGLRVGLVVSGQTPEEKKAAYAADVVYGTNNEFGFDYLRDNMAFSLDSQVQRSLHYAIIDEVDSVLIDEARTPLIIAGPGGPESKLYRLANRFVKLLGPEDYEKDEKLKAVQLTEKGIQRAEMFFSVDNLADIVNMELFHCINKALYAHKLMQRDRDYIVAGGEVVIVDAFTGRTMPGRRFSDGLHQAIEAKENVPVNAETQTIAAITFQNYFRMFDKLAGMTGTAKTEEDEFSSIYNLNVVTIPTNRPMIRVDHEDEIYATEAAKFEAVTRDVLKRHEKGQPVLIGTVSIEKSEALSGYLQREGIEHTVLNAKYHEQEAEIISKAGQAGAVTISTNMAGRGTDIGLGEAVQALGGLYVIGTERHESRRIDNQLRGRSGRQGDPGESRFYLSLEDPLLRIFGDERMKKLSEVIDLQEGEAITSKILTKGIENAQKKMESKNFDDRKNVLKYDNVMNRQREIIYKQRQQVLDGENIHDQILAMGQRIFASVLDIFISDPIADHWDIQGLKEALGKSFFPETDFKFVDTLKNREALEQALGSLFSSHLEKLSAKIGRETRDALEREVLLKAVDMAWMDHIDNMDQLKQGIGLRSYGQNDPVKEYTKEGFAMFDEMVQEIQENTIRTLLRCQADS